MEKPTLSRVLFRQGFFHVAILGFAIVGVGSVLGRNWFDEDSVTTVMGAPLFILIAGIGTLIGSSLKQYRRAISLVEQGNQTKGKVIDKYGGYVAYEYQHHGQIYRASEKLFCTQGRKFKVGQEMPVVVNHQSPGQALLYDLYQ